jgi:hypothetical protein
MSSGWSRRGWSAVAGFKILTVSSQIEIHLEKENPQKASHQEDTHF